MSEPNANKPETGVTPNPTPAAAAPPKPAPPTKPVAPAKPAAGKGPTRRWFMISWFAAGMGAMTVSLLGMTLGTLRFLFPNVLSEASSRFRAGRADDYELNKVSDGFKNDGAWVIRARNEKDQEVIYALSTTCTHLGCTPNWLEAEKKFKCPCHGSGFYITGVNFEGPAPRPLERYAIRRTDDGQIEVDKSRKFQRELQQWNDPESFILLG